jgi:hypothetical protein
MVVEKSNHKNSNEAVAHAKKKAEREAARVANALARQRSQYLILKLQSGFRGFNARKNVWTLKNGGKPLDEKDMNDGLGQLGRSPSSTLGRNPSYMNFTLRFKKLNDISLLSKYPLLTTIDISHNHIPSLEALSVMPYLWKVCCCVLHKYEYIYQSARYLNRVEWLTVVLFSLSLSYFYSL